MTATSEHPPQHLRYHKNAYQFVFQALQYTQERLDRKRSMSEEGEDEAHISGQELLSGVRDLALEQFGMLAGTVFKRWGIRATEDFGRIVFELVERGEMRKTDRDQLSDFYDVFDFEEAFDHDYTIDTSAAF
ncbi:MAG: hypothetical protein HON53_05745 [Planctomycetaceae bacterium]|jgi:uncharacterized repeat protein (TIGR04138 family)|nr:hypothetical protein [Planctomycetaceae bacterium]MBT6153573.1 hypothetical protein [Planctomycetaceae bacterium]MBT6483046.1 hypothetical protein [Planctomycetaceae bacterium]MBT6497599.1 hypothetical protein [Planctomycetaceae bacterium]